MKQYAVMALTLFLATSCETPEIRPQQLASQLNQAAVGPSFFLGKIDDEYSWAKIHYSRDGEVHRARLVYTQDESPRLEVADAEDESTQATLEFVTEATATTQLLVYDANNALVYAQYMEAGTKSFALDSLPVPTSSEYTLGIIDTATGDDSKITGMLMP